MKPTAYSVTKISGLFFSSLMLLSILTACGGGGGGGSAGGGSTVLGVPLSNGSVTDPVSISIGQPGNGTVGTGSNYYVVSGLVQGQFYAIQAYALTANVALYGYSDPGFILAMCSSDNPGTVSEACSTMADANGKIYIRVSGANSGGSANFTLRVMPAALVEGSSSTPLDVSTLLPYSGTSGHGTSSFYVVNNLTPGQLYTVAFANVLYNPEMNVYQRKQFDYAVCTSINLMGLDESCVIAANFEGRIYIKANANNGSTLNQIGSYYDISVTPATGTEFIFQGYSDAPVNITGMLPYSGQVNRSDSYYKLTGLTAGTRYELRLNNAVPTSILAYTTSTFIGSSCTINSYQESLLRTTCVIAAPASGELYIQIPASGSGRSYAMDIALAPVAEGSASVPKGITTPYDGQVDGTASYYVINGLIPEWNYKVLLGNATNNVTLWAGSSTNLNATNAGIIGRTNVNGSLFIKIDGSSTNGNGARYTLGYEVSINPQGTLAAPVDITSATPSAPYVGQVDNRNSYYKITGLATNNSYYMVHLSDNTEYVSVYVWDNSSFTGTSKCSMVYQNHCLASAPVSGTLYIQVAGYTGSVVPAGTQFKLWIAPSLLKSEGLTTTPVALGVGTPYAGKVTSFTPDRYSYYVVSGLPGSTSYNVALSNTTDNLDLHVFSDNTYSDVSELCRSLRKGLFDENCVATTLSSGGGSNKSLYIRVGSEYLKSYDGASYTLTVTNGATPVTNEGAAGAPLSITTPYAGKVRATVSATQSSYYKISALDPVSRYSVIVDNPTEAVDLAVYSDATFTTGLCSKDSFFEPNKGACAALPNNLGELYVKVSSKYMADSSYTLKVVAAPVAEGGLSVPVPIPLTSLPYSGQVGAGKSYYMVSGLVPGADYIATLNNLTNRGYLAIYGDSAFTVYKGQSLVEENVTSFVGAADSNGYLYIAVDGSYSNNNGVFFDLAVRAAPQSEGTKAAPIAIISGTPFAGQKKYPGSTNSYYKISGLVPHSSHQASLRNLTMTASVRVFGSADFTHELCDSDLVSSYRVGCGAAANADGEMYIEVFRDGGYYDIYVP